MGVTPFLIWCPLAPRCGHIEANPAAILAQRHLAKPPFDGGCNGVRDLVLVIERRNLKVGYAC